jgi:hypothetical protein
MRAAWTAAILGMALLPCCTPARAHSASDAYLTMTAGGAPGRQVLRGQWDIALRDLNFVLDLDDDGDGHVTWGETKHHLADIERYAFSRLHIADDTGLPCVIEPAARSIDDHADGAYVALFFGVSCPRPATKLRLDYRLFFDLDPSHRGIFVLHDGEDIATSVLAPQNAAIELLLR